MSKFSVDDHVRVTDIEHEKCDQVGRVDHVFRELNGWLYSVNFYGVYMPIREHHLILADPDVHETLDEMDAQSAPTQFARNLKAIQDEKNTDLFGNPLSAKDLAEMEIDGEYDRGKECVSELPKTGVTAADKLRMIADTVEQQLPVGSELASFRRRLSAILSIGHDA